MKKLMFTVAVAAGLAAFGTGIESANTVGYTTKAIAQNDYALTAVQFETVDQQNNITNLISTSDAGTTAWNGDDNVPGWYNSAMTLMVPNGEGGYSFYYYAADGWDDANETEYPGWCDEYGYIQANVTLTTGLGVWFKGSASGNESITMSGQVLDEATTATSVGSGYTIIANPYPVASDIQTVTTTASAATAWDGDDNVPGWYNSAPTIMIPNGEGGYSFYYYAADGWDDDNETEYAGWCDEYGYIQKNITLPVTTGIWFKNNAAATVTFTK
jgi:coproporphyrinogen III oxidase